ncbi:MAG TPA: hypothetical protein VMS86_06225 [Thermoanaerobaculia bacterium]|nr:hypothetical protein [Thermoanaerobaculia bacterium]
MLTASEYHMRERLPLSAVQESILDFCRGRKDTVVFGAQAVNLHTEAPRMTQDVDLLSDRPGELAEALKAYLHERLGIAVRSRSLGGGRAFRIYQVRAQGNRHLADVRRAILPLEEAIERDGIRYASVEVLVAMKVIALTRRRFAPKGGTDLADVRRLLLARPELRTETGPVSVALQRLGASKEAFDLWRDLLAEPIVSDEETDEDY